MADLHIPEVEKMSDMRFLQSLDRLGTYEELTDIIAYLAAKRPMTTQRLEYILYFAFGWGLLLLHRQIAPLSFHQTPYGPREATVSKLYPSYDIVPVSSVTPRLDNDLKNLLDIALDTYADQPIRELEVRLMHHMYGEPGDQISARKIYLFFATVTYLVEAQDGYYVPFS